MSHTDLFHSIDARVAQARAALADMRVAEGLTLARQAWADVQGLADPQADRASHAQLQGEVGLLKLRLLFYAGDYQSALEFGQRLLPLTEGPDLAPIRCEVLRGLATTSMESSDFGNGLEYAMANYALAEGLGNVELMCGALGVVGDCFNRLGDHGHAERVLMEALEQTSRLSRPLNRVSVIAALSETNIDAFLRYRDTGELDRALANLDRAYTHASALWSAARALEPQNPAVNVVAQGNLGAVRLHRGDTSGARQLLQAALVVAEAHGLKAHAWYARCYLAECEMKEGQWQTGYDHLKDLLAQRHDKEGSSGVRRIHHALYVCCKQLGLLAEALTHLEAYQIKEAQRLSAHLAVQAKLFVSRLEADQARRQTAEAQAQALKQERRALEMTEAAETDPLTGLGNRRALQSRAPLLLAAAAQSGRDVSLVMLDLDHFKQINDRFGHAAGDKVLQQLALILRDHTRPEDLLVRLGGEEFLMFMVGPDPLTTAAICERLRAAIEHHGWTVIDPALSVTTSIGWSLGPDQGLEALMARADAALYQAKRQGRNRVVADALAGRVM